MTATAVTSTKTDPVVCALVLCHRRPWLLRLIAEQLKEEFPRARALFTLDRPSTEVELAVEEARSVLGPNAHVHDLGLAALSESGERFMEARRRQLAVMRHFWPDGIDYVALWDDDHILACPEESREVLRLHEPYLTYIRKLYLWNTPGQVRTDLFKHHSVFWFRHDPTDDFPLDRTIHATARVHDDEHHARDVEDLQQPLLDIGYLYPAERERVFSTYKRAGKLDAATLPLLDLNPPLATYLGPHTRWYNRLVKALT